MKKYIVILTLAAFAAVSYAGDKSTAPKTKTASADGKTDCAAATACCAKEQVAKKSCNTKKIVMSPKAAGEVGR